MSFTPIRSLAARGFLALLLPLLLPLSLPLAAQAAPVAATNAAALPRDSVYQLQAPLTDQSGRRITLASRRGNPQVVVMFYTSCKFICPTIVDTVLDLDRNLSAAEKPRLGVLLISLDAQRDDPGALKTLADKRGLDLGRWTLAQPQAADVRAIAGLLGVRYRPLADGEFNHTGVLVLLDADGRIVARSSQTAGAAEPQFLRRVQAELARR